MARWDPWDEVLARHDIVVEFRELPDWTGGGMAAVIDGLALVTLDPRLSPTERDVTLAHELIHTERDRELGCTRRRWMPATWAAVEAREEILVDREVARRLVPRDELEEFVDEMCGIGLGVGPDDVAERFDVTPLVGREALLELARTAPAYARRSA